MACLDYEQMRFVIGKLVATDAQHVTAAHVRLLADATSAFDDDEWTAKCLDLLWAVIQSDRQGKCVRDAAMDLFCRSRTNLLLSRGYKKQYRARYLDECSANLQRHKSVGVTLAVLQRLIDTLSAESKEFGKTKLPRLVDAFFADVEHFKAVVAKQLGDAQLSESEVNRMDIYGVGPYLAQVAQRIHFLTFLVERQAVKLSESQKDVVRVAFIGNALSAKERKMAEVALGKVDL